MIGLVSTSAIAQAQAPASKIQPDTLVLRLNAGELGGKFFGSCWMHVGTTADFGCFSLRLMGITGDTVRVRLTSKRGNEADLFPFTDKEPSLFLTDGQIFSIRRTAPSQSDTDCTFDIYQLVAAPKKKPAPHPPVKEI